MVAYASGMSTTLLLGDENMFQAAALIPLDAAYPTKQSFSHQEAGSRQGTSHVLRRRFKLALPAGSKFAIVGMAVERDNCGKDTK